jgi:hypothetical protein
MIPQAGTRDDLAFAISFFQCLKIYIGVLGNTHSKNIAKETSQTARGWWY